MAVLENTTLQKRERKRKTREIIGELGIDGVRKQKAFTLSGGERRRTEIARALAIEPKFLLLDEPFAGVDPIAVFDIQSIIERLKSKGLGILITDHNVRETLRITDRAYIMNEGEILVSGGSEYLVNNEEAKRIYLGINFTI
jgi:lipopolysaccharide export system ATP-binding protein